MANKKYIGRDRLYNIMKNNVDGEHVITDVDMCCYRKYRGCEWIYAYTPTYTVYAIASGFGAFVRVQLLDDDYKPVKEIRVRPIEESIQSADSQ